MLRGGTDSFVMPAVSKAECMDDSKPDARYSQLKGCHTWGGCKCEAAQVKPHGQLCQTTPRGQPMREMWTQGKHWCCNAPEANIIPNEALARSSWRYPYCLKVSKKNCAKGDRNCAIPQFSRQQCENFPSDLNGFCSNSGSCACMPAIKKTPSAKCAYTPTGYKSGA